MRLHGHHPPRPFSIGFAIVLLAASCGSSARAQQSPFRLEIRPEQVMIGEPVDLFLTVTESGFNPDRIVDVTFEPQAERWEVALSWRRDLKPEDRAAGRMWLAMIKPFEVGDLPLPATIVRYRTESGATTDTAATTTTLRVRSIRQPGASDELIPLRPPVTIPRQWNWLITVAVVIVLALLSAWALTRWWLRRERRSPLKPPEPELPPGLWALREIDRRSRLPICQTGPAKPIFTHVSEVIRIYLERRYQIPAIDMTTLECLRAVQRRKLDPELMRWLKEFLDQCDMVKFTRIEPPRERWAAIWDDARLIVKMTTPAEELGAPGSAAPAVGEASA